MLVLPLERKRKRERREVREKWKEKRGEKREERKRGEPVIPNETTPPSPIERILKEKKRKSFIKTK